MKDLTEKQAVFVLALAAGVTKEQAAEQAGYSPQWLNIQANSLLRLPHVQEAIRYEAERLLELDGPWARAGLRRLAEHAESEKVRAECLKALLDRSGFIPQRTKNGTSIFHVPLNELTTADLRAAADRLETELANRANPVLAIEGDATLASNMPDSSIESMMD